MRLPLLKKANALLVVITLLADGCYVYRTPPSATPPFAQSAIASPLLDHAAAVGDLDTLIAIVADVHPDPGPRLAALRDSLVRVWPASLTRGRLWRDLARVLASMSDGHTSLRIPSEEINAAMAAGQRAFPLGVTRTVTGIVVTAVLGGDTARVTVGDRVVRVNGAPVDDIVHELGRSVSAELDAFRDRTVLMSFGPRLWLEGTHPPLQLAVVRADGSERTVTLEGALLSDFARRPVQRARPPLTARRTTDSVLVVDFTSMGGDAVTLKTRLDSAFAAARVEGVRAVVVDLRRNGGGNSEQGITLLSYVTRQPLTMGLYKEWRASKRYRAHIKSGLSPLIRWLPLSWFDASIGGFFSVKDGEVVKLTLGAPVTPGTNPHRLERPLCVLIGPSTFSSAMMLANTVRLSGAGTLIGEPTGEPPNSHGEVLTFRLPKSGLAGQVSSARFVLDPDSAGAHRGVLPDVVIAHTTADVVAGRDPAMDRAMRCGRGSHDGARQSTRLTHLSRSNTLASSRASPLPRW